MKKVFFALALFSLTFVSCDSEDQDTTKPVIDIHAPLKDAEFALGSEIHFEADLSDNEELNSYKIDIHIAEGHTHTKSLAASWSFQKEVSISGKKNHHADERINIPADIRIGEYHIVVYCTDKSGNEQIAYTDVIVTDAQ